MRVRHILAVLVLGMSLGCATMDEDAVQPDPQATHLGLLYSLSGAYGGFGPSVQQATELAVEEINAAGGVNGKRLDLRVANDKMLRAAGLIGARGLVDEGVVGIVGGSSSSVTLGAAEEVTIPAGIPLVSPSATSPALSDLQDQATVWRTIPSDAFQGVILADQILAKGILDIGVIFDDNAYGSGLANAFRTRFLAMGGTVKSYVSYPDGKVIGFSDEVTALFAQGVPSGVLIVGYLGDSANITRDIQQSAPSPSPMLFGVDANYAPSFLANAAATLVEGMQGTAPSPPASAPNYMAFRDRFLQKTGKLPLLYSESAYDAVYLMALAMAAGGANTKEAIVANLGPVSRPSGQPGDVLVRPGEFAQGLAALQAGHPVNYEGASGAIDFDANGDVTSGTYIWWKVVRGTDGQLGYQTMEVIAFP